MASPACVDAPSSPSEARSGVAAYVRTVAVAVPLALARDDRSPPPPNAEPRVGLDALRFDELSDLLEPAGLVQVRKPRVIDAPPVYIVDVLVARRAVPTLDGLVSLQRFDSTELLDATVPFLEAQPDVVFVTGDRTALVVQSHKNRAGSQQLLEALREAGGQRW